MLILLIILLSLVCIKYLISKSNKYISENGKSSMGAVIDQIQQTYDLQVSGYYSQLQLVEEFLLHERELSLETDTNKSFFEAWEKESESTLIFLQENGQAISAGGTKMRIDMPSKLLLDLKNGILENWCVLIMIRRKKTVIWLRSHVRNTRSMGKLIRQLELCMIIRNWIPC